MDDRIIGGILIIFGLLIASFGGTMSSVTQAIFYIVGMLIALVGGVFFVKYFRRTPRNSEN